MKKVLILLSNGCEPLELAAFTDVMGWTSETSGEIVISHTCALRKEINTSWGLKIVPDYGVEDIQVDDYAALAVPGGFETFGFYEDAFDARFSELIRKFNDRGKPIASICTGALAIAHSGILANRNATTYQLSGAKRLEQLSKYNVNISMKSIVIDGNVISSAGPSTAIQVAFELLRMISNDETVEEVKYQMGFK